jgi:aldehyde:ferredoxin oxidoreductase
MFPMLIWTGYLTSVIQQENFMTEWVNWRVNLTTGEIEVAHMPEDRRGLGGRALTSATVSEMVPPRSDPLGSENVLVLATGLLAGSRVSSSARLSVGAKSPLTGGIKESNVGGAVGDAFSKWGVRSLIVEGVSHEWKIAHLSAEGMLIVPAQDLVGLDVYQTVAKLQEQYGKKTVVLAIGPAGEARLSAANIGVSDRDGIPSRHAGRGGLGAVMGSKRLKAIVIDADAGKSPAPLKAKELSRAVKSFSRALLDSGSTLTDYGTAILVGTINAVGGLPTRNYQSGQFEGAEKIGGEALHDLIEARAGKIAHACMPGCVLRCSNVVPGPTGDEVTRGLEYESITLLGANCGIDDLDVIAQLNRRCDELGLDTIEIGVALGIALEAGLAEFGDAKAVMSMLEEIGSGTPMGRVLGHGACVTGQVLGVSRVPAVRGQAMAAYDPRALKGTGVTYATSPMGADHTAGNALPGSTLPDGTKPDPASPENQVELSRYLQQLALVFDMLGLCWFTRAPILQNHRYLLDTLDALGGDDWSIEALFDLARNTLAIEVAFNQRSGMMGVDDVPYYFRVEPLGPGGKIFDVPPQLLATTLADLEE